MENTLNLENNILVCIEPAIEEKDQGEYLYLKENFCGRVLDTAAKNASPGTIDLSTVGPHGVVYACGNIQLLRDRTNPLPDGVKVIRDFSYNYEAESGLEFVSLGEVPINLHGLAVYYRNYMTSDSDDKNYFDLLQSKHKLQSLTESNKGGTSFRKGAYLSEVETDGDTDRFHLLRCSTNLVGPTLAFADEDREILRKLNELGRRHFDREATFNHVLAQVYENSVTVDGAGNRAKEHKAKIKSHSDKTKDMPPAGLIAFTTFYSSDISTYKPPRHDRLDRNFKGASVLTKLRFRLKDSAKQQNQNQNQKQHHIPPPYGKDVTVPLYPNSVLLIPLSTNRMYTHEIVPPTLPVGRFPTRLGYVVRCSKTRAVFRDGAVFVEREGGRAGGRGGGEGEGEKFVKLKHPTEEEFAELKKLYIQENVSADIVEYPDIWFSMNEGDFLRPQVEGVV